MAKKKVCKDCCCPCNGLILLVIGIFWLLKELAVIKSALVLPILLILAGLYLRKCKCK